MVRVGDALIPARSDHIWRCAEFHTGWTEVAADRSLGVCLNGKELLGSDPGLRDGRRITRALVGRILSGGSAECGEVGDVANIQLVGGGSAVVQCGDIELYGVNGCMAPIGDVRVVADGSQLLCSVGVVAKDGREGPLERTNIGVRGGGLWGGAASLRLGCRRAKRSGSRRAGPHRQEGRSGLRGWTGGRGLRWLLGDRSEKGVPTWR